MTSSPDASSCDRCTLNNLTLTAPDMKSCAGSDRSKLSDHAAGSTNPARRSPMNSGARHHVDDGAQRAVKQVQPVSILEGPGHEISDEHRGRASRDHLSRRREVPRLIESCGKCLSTDGLVGDSHQGLRHDLRIRQLNRVLRVNEAQRGGVRVAIEGFGARAPVLQALQ